MGTKKMQMRAIFVHHTCFRIPHESGGTEYRDAPYLQLLAISVVFCEINKMNDSVPIPSVALRKMTESGLLDYIVEMAGNCTGYRSC